jgi:AraC family transcriptional regulator
MKDDSTQLAGLPAWRLKRVLSFIDANIDKRLGLSQIAQAAGFSRMHFARQFRASTGLRPHEYLLRRRVEHAQELLVQSYIPVASIARASGFSTQAHFTSVFRRFVGKPPAHWRRAMTTSMAAD